MPFSIAATQGKLVLKLEGAVTIRHAQDLAAKLAENLEVGTPLGVDTAGLEDVDTCILQLLFSLRNTVREFSFDNPSDAFIGAVDRCGLRRELLGAREDL
jgi:anti-anti-sigma regulatory factor